MTLRDYGVSVVRTVTPVVVAFIVARLAGVGVEIDSDALTTVLSGLFVGGYYAIVRGLEAKFPAAGVLLGWKASPKYDRG